MYFFNVRNINYRFSVLIVNFGTQVKYIEFCLYCTILSYSCFATLDVPSLSSWQFFRRRRSRIRGTIATGIRNSLHAYSEHLHEKGLIFPLKEATSSDND